MQSLITVFMVELSLHIEKAGLQTLIMDQGRSGWQEKGVPVGGALDRLAAATANYLVGNPPETPVLEITLMGPQIRFSGQGQIAICGADLNPQLDQQPAKMYQTITVEAQQRLHFGRVRNGCRTYVAIRGRWEIPKWLGSASAFTALPALTPKSFLQKGDILQFEASTLIPTRSFLPPHEPEQYLIHLLEGPEFHLFSPQHLAHFFSQTHRI
ncbi:MAG: biotin-dependent carboxyltransferase family protein, partial [Bacteroidota bacterium]